MPYRRRSNPAFGLATFGLLAMVGGCSSDRSDATSSDAGPDGRVSDEDGLLPSAEDVPLAPDKSAPGTDTSPLEAAASDAPIDAPPAVVVDAAPAVDGGLAVSPLAREIDPQVPADDMTTLASDNAAFAFDMYAKLKETSNDNIVVSPASISLALAMTYAGAANDTATEMAQALHFTLPPERLHRAFNALEQTLVARGQGFSGSDGGAFSLNIANSAWLQQGFVLAPSFLDTLAVSYGAGVNLVDFAHAAEPARLRINAWVAEQTAGNIEQLLPQGAVDELTKLVLANAVYFNAAWLYPFNATNNQSNNFTLLDGTVTTKTYMFASLSIGAVQGTGFVAGALPYQDTRLSMVIVVPDPGRFAEVEASLDAASFSTLMKGLTSHKVNLYLPHFHLKTDTSLGPVLQSLGMRSAFDGGAADFSGMGPKGISVSAVIHEAFVKVAEKGTEAGAATAVILGDSGITGDAGPPPLVIKAERPFLYFIYDQPTGSILFMGRVLAPIQY